MKKSFFILLIFAAILISCTKVTLPVTETKLDLKITEQPVGGTEIFTTTVSFIGTIQGVVKPVDVTVNWYKETEAHAAEQLALTEVYTFKEGRSIAKSSTIRVMNVFPQVSFYYWAVITWTDDTGKEHSIQTNKVQCTTEKEF